MKKINNVVGARNVNVSAQYLRTQGDLGYVVMDIEPQQGRAIFDELRDMSETVRARVLW